MWVQEWIQVMVTEALKALTVWQDVGGRRFEYLFRSSMMSASTQGLSLPVLCILFPGSHPCCFMVKRSGPTITSSHNPILIGKGGNKKRAFILERLYVIREQSLSQKLPANLPFYFTGQNWLNTGLTLDTKQWSLTSHWARCHMGKIRVLSARKEGSSY